MNVLDNKELNIKSSTIEKGLELAKEFIGKLVSPSVEEIGLLVSDNIKFWRFKNQIKILNRAEKYVNERNISVKNIPLKILVPLLENASLEEEEGLQDKWARLIANLSDSKSSLQNAIFPFILNQLSLEEFECIYSYIKFEKGVLVTSKMIGISEKLEPFQIDNLERLGLIKQLPLEFNIEKNVTHWKHEAPSESYEVEYVGDDEYELTTLGETFLKICN